MLTKNLMGRIKTFDNLKLTKIVISGFFIMLFISPACRRGNSPEPSFADIENGFKNIPDTVQTSIYWYWISDNISKEGVVKDLEAMKRVGINRAFIGNIGLSDLPSGKVKIFTDEWWDPTHCP
jgi:hypothetical protein